MSAEWYWNMAGTEVGPLTAEQLRAMVVAGKLTPADLIKRGAQGEWVRAGDVTSLFPASGAWADVASPTGPQHGAQQQAPDQRATSQSATPLAADQQPAAGQTSRRQSSSTRPVGKQSAGSVAAGGGAAPVAPTSQPVSAVPAGVKRPPLRAIPLDDEPPGAKQPARPQTAAPRPIRSSGSLPAAAAPAVPLVAVRTEAAEPAARTSPGYTSEAVSLSEKRKRRERMIFYGSLAAIGVALVVGIVAWSLSGSGDAPAEQAAQPKVAQPPKKPLEEDLSDPTVLEKAKTVSDPSNPPAVVLDQPSGEQPAATQWVDASKGQFAARGEVKVRVRELCVGVPTLVTAAGEQHPRGSDYLWIVLEIVNTSKNQRLEYAGLRVGTAGAQPVVLTDNLGRPCPPARFRTGAAYSVKGQVTTAVSVEPGESIEDVLLYKDPRGADRKDARVKLLRLQLPGRPFGQQGTFNFEVPLSMAREVARPAQQAPEQPGQPGDESEPSAAPQPGPSPSQPKPQPPRPKGKEPIPGVIDEL